jgi:hypothetical protein
MAVLATATHQTKAEEEAERDAETQESCPFTSGGPPAKRLRRPVKKTDRERLRARARTMCLCHTWLGMTAAAMHAMAKSTTTKLRDVFIMEYTIQQTKVQSLSQYSNEAPIH